MIQRPCFCLKRENTEIDTVSADARSSVLGFVSTPSETSLDLSQNHYCSDCANQIAHCSCYTDDYVDRLDLREYYQSLDEEGRKNIISTLEVLYPDQFGTTVFTNQSGTEVSYSNMETMKSQNVRFSDQYNGPMTTLESRPDKTRSATDTYDTDLTNFFSRPIKIDEKEWTVGNALDYFIDPWTLYFSNPRVQNRITTYNLLRADLHLKIVINGNGFYYGRAQAAYLPNSNYDALTGSTSFWDLVQWSQMPKIFINPTTSMAGEMIIPFHLYQNNAWIQNGNVNDLGRLWVRSYNDLLHANGASGASAAVNVSIFAWAENVQLSVLTSMDVGGLTPQSGEIDEANSKGIVSGPATTVSKWAGYLKEIPIISPYATATQKAANVTAEIASAFGYCRPPLTKAPEPYRPTAVSSLANTNVPDVVQKLTVDHKQELTIDPSIAGYGEKDLMSIKSIASRESFFAQFDWATTAVGEDLLWNCRVDPCQFVQDGSKFYFPSLCAAALPFKYWTGTLKFRFQIVCSTFHKGRIKIVYDPNQIDGTEYNTNYMKIVDIADEQDVTIEVGVGRPTTLLTHSEPGTDTFASMASTSALSYSEAQGNGVLGVYVVNKLGVPNSVATNDISVNVFISASDDFEVFAPYPYFQNFVFRTQSGFLNQSGEATIPEHEATDEPNAPVKMNSENIAVESFNLPETNLVYTGESIQSFRTLLKRYNKFRTIGYEEYPPTRMNNCFANFPFLRGYVAGAINITSNTTPYNYCNTVLLHWVTYMFSGWRGSIRYKLIPRITGMSCDITVSRRPTSSTNDYSFQTSFNNPKGNTSAIAYDAVYINSDLQAGIAPGDREQSGTSGIAYANSQVNPVLEWEMPYYSKYRYVPGKTENWTSLNNPFTEYCIVCINQTIENGQSGFNEPSAAGCFDYHVAAGEDFQTYFFTGLPPMYLEVLPPMPPA